MHSQKMYSANHLSSYLLYCNYNMISRNLILHQIFEGFFTEYGLDVYWIILISYINFFSSTQNVRILFSSLKEEEVRIWAKSSSLCRKKLGGSKK